MNCEYFKGVKYCRNNSKASVCALERGNNVWVCCYWCKSKCGKECRKAKTVFEMYGKMNYCVPDECEKVGECGRCKK